MPYRINKWNGNELTVLEDGRINATTSVKLVGRNYAGYGEVQNENFLWLLENFAADSAPPSPLIGQVYYNTATKILNVYDGADWNPVSAASVTDTSPTTPAKGDLWVKQSSKQLFFYDGTTPYNTSGWQLVGPESADVPFGITRLISGRVRDLSGNYHAIIKMTVNGDVLGILSSDIFTINSLDAIVGFSSLTRGFNLSNTANFTASVDGNAGTANKLKVPRKINGVDFDGTADITVSAVLSKSLSRGTYLIGTATSFNGSADVTFSVDATDANTGGKIVARDVSGNFSAGQITATSFVGNLTGNLTGDVKASNGTIVLDSGTTGANATFVGSVTGNVTGNAATASKLLQSRTINGVAFDGTQNITITAGATSGLTAGSYIDVVSYGDSTSVYDGSASATWNVKGEISSIPNTLVARNAQSDIFAREITASQGFKGNADSATKLQTARTINGINFDGSQNITIYDSSKVPLSGGTLTGFLTLHQDPVNNYHAATKIYVDQLYVAKAGSTMSGLLTLAGDPTIDLHAATKKYVDKEVKAVQDDVDGLQNIINTTTFTHGTNMAIGFSNSVGNFSDSSNYFDVFPPTGKTMAKLIAFIPSIAYIAFAGDVNGDDSMRCYGTKLSDRIRVYVQNTEQRATPSANWLAIWGP